MAINFEDLVSKYVRLRDKIAEIEAAHAEVLKPYKEMKEVLGKHILDNMRSLGLENVKTGAGTAYVNKKTSVTLADKNAFTRHVIGEQAFDLVDMRPSKEAVVAFIEEHKEPPPGVNFSAMIDIGIRRK